MAGRRLVRPAREEAKKKRTETVRQPAAEKNVPKNTPCAATAALLLRRPEMGGGGSGNVHPQEPVHKIGCSRSCREEALRWRRSSTPLARSCGLERGGLVGAIPEALCGEAPQGQPRNHRPRPRKTHCARPMEEERSNRRRRKEGLADPPSSQSRRVGRRDSGGRSRE